MNQTKKRGTRRLLLALCWALVTVLLAGSGLLDNVNRVVTDYLLRHAQEKDERIFVVGIDPYALQEIGAWPWSRAVMADIVNTLNADEKNRPAAIGLDVVYSGATDAAADEALAQAARAGNVAVACTAEFGGQMVLQENDVAYMDDFKVANVAMPFEALAQGARVGHVNAMYDTDGVLRHHLWAVQAPGGAKLMSLPYQLYALYCEQWGLRPDFVPKTDARGFWRVDFSGGPDDYYAYSAADILSGDYDPDLLKGAIVLIGPYDPGLSDDFVTVVDRAHRMYGVEYLANVTANMLNGISKAELEEVPQLVAVFFICLAVGIVFFNLKLRWIIPLYLLLLASGVAYTRWLYQVGWVTQPLWLLMGLTLLLLGSITEHYYIAILDRRYISRVFERYVDPSIMRELLRENSDTLGMGGKSCEIAVLFVDIRGFTTLSEQLEPQKVVQILNEYLALTSRCIRSNGGTLDKFVGDCTMAIWGAPLPCKDPVRQACAAALEMVRGSTELTKSLQERYGYTVGFGIGVHYGEAVVGNIGSPERMDYTAIGDTVNTAARLEANAPAGRIYISRAVADRLGSGAMVTSLGTGVRLKGKAEGFEILVLEAFENQGEDCGKPALN